jgi:exodeoxyribonuclease VII large subunit
MNQPLLFEDSPLSVGELTRHLRELIEADPLLQDVWVRGEISNLSRPQSGHIYLTLKDDAAALRAVIWRSQAARLRIDLQNGQAVEAHGYISLYEASGQYQLYIDTLRPVGEGYLYLEFLRLKARLEAEGLFDPARKRPLPARPRRIGMVTSPTGAALQDMLNTLRQRCPLVEVVIAPAAVQGEAAPGEIAAALEALGRRGNVDVIIVGRGGGSLEDLWAFNDERVVRAVAASPVPVISGVGHETDFTLADFAADVRAPTPTGAAVLAVPDIADIRTELSAAGGSLEAALADVILARRMQLEPLRITLQHLSPGRQLDNDRQRLDELGERQGRAWNGYFERCRAQQEAVALHLEALNPLAVLRRGFAVVTTAGGSLVTRAAGVQPGDELRLRLQDGALATRVTGVEIGQPHPAN